MAADEEEDYVVAQANAPLNPDGTFKNLVCLFVVHLRRRALTTSEDA